jgi:hypothetical protein
MVEYVLPTSLVLVISLAGLQQLGAGFSGQLGNVFNTNAPDSSYSGLPADISGGALAGLNPSDSTTAPLPTALQAANNNPSAAPMLETTGSNGIGSLVTGSITELEIVINDLKAQQADSQLVDILSRLANHGHSIGHLMDVHSYGLNFQQARMAMTNAYLEYHYYKQAHFDLPFYYSYLPPDVQHVIDKVYQNVVFIDQFSALNATIYHTLN